MSLLYPYFVLIGLSNFTFEAIASAFIELGDLMKGLPSFSNILYTISRSSHLRRLFPGINLAFDLLLATRGMIFLSLQGIQSLYRYCAFSFV